MDYALLAIACSTAIFLVFTLLDSFFGFKTIRRLTQQYALPARCLPTVSIIFSALDEEDAIEAAVMSFVNQQYPALEIIAVNDRSTDTTPAILNRLQQQYPNLSVIHIDTLPHSWLGKNHALQVAATKARGEWLLFTDADVLMKPDTLQQAMSYAVSQAVDHLTIFEHHIRKTFWLRVLSLAHYVSYAIECKPWRAARSASRYAIGHGAFNLVKKTVYQACGGHESIALACLDDMRLGKLIKQQGFKQDTVDGRDYIEREWYTSLPNMIQGVQKNSFAYFNYQLWHAVRVSCYAVIFLLWPFVSMWLSSGWLQALNTFNVLAYCSINAYIACHFRIEKRYALFYPLGIVLVIYSVWNSIFYTYRHQGVIWRGTHYPLAILRAAETA